MTRLPISGSDQGSWGAVLNDFLSIEHNADGTQKTLSITKGGTGGADTTTARANLALHATNLPFTPVGTVAGTDVQTAITEAASEAHPNIQTFTSDGTWTKPPGVTMVRIQCIGGGAGGGSGRRAGSGVACGGGGGGGGGAVDHILPASMFNVTEPVVVGAGGAGGAAITTNDTDGITGTMGGNSGFSTGNTYVGTFTASPAVGGSGGTNASGPGGLGGIAQLAGSSGGAASTIGSGGATGGLSNTGCTGGGAGCGANVISTGGPGGQQRLRNFTGTNASDTVGAPGLDGPTGVFLPGVGGGGGDMEGSGLGHDGGRGGLYGGGGGGGSASLNGNVSGAGGNGASGIVVVISW